MAQNDLYRVRLKMIAAGIPFYTYWHFRMIGTLAKAQDMCNLWTGASSTLWSSYSFLLSNQVRLLSCQAAQINNGGLDLAEKAAASTLVGKHAGTMMPLNVCGRVNWRTGLPGRSRKGCTYIAGLSSLRHVGGYWNQAQIDNTIGWINDFLGAFGSNGSGVNWRVGIFSKKLGGYYPNAQQIGFATITAGSFMPLTVSCEKKIRDEASKYPEPFI
jgi:hypothetical protein